MEYRCFCIIEEYDIIDEFTPFFLPASNWEEELRGMLISDEEDIDEEGEKRFQECLSALKEQQYYDLSTENQMTGSLIYLDKQIYDFDKEPNTNTKQILGYFDDSNSSYRCFVFNKETWKEEFVKTLLNDSLNTDECDEDELMNIAEEIDEERFTWGFDMDCCWVKQDDYHEGSTFVFG